MATSSKAGASESQKPKIAAPAHGSVLRELHRLEIGATRGPSRSAAEGTSEARSGVSERRRTGKVAAEWAVYASARSARVASARGPVHDSEVEVGWELVAPNDSLRGGCGLSGRPARSMRGHRGGGNGCRTEFGIRWRASDRWQE